MTSPTMTCERMSQANRSNMTSSCKTPKMSVVEAAGWLIIDMDMPGVVARDLDVTVDGSIVTIKSLPRVDAPKTPVRITTNRIRTTVERTIELPTPVDMGRRDLIKANLLDGILRLVLPTTRPHAETQKQHQLDARS